MYEYFEDVGGMGFKPIDKDINRRLTLKRHPEDTRRKRWWDKNGRIF